MILKVKDEDGVIHVSGTGRVQGRITEIRNDSNLRIVFYLVIKTKRIDDPTKSKGFRYEVITMKATMYASRVKLGMYETIKTLRDYEQVDFKGTLSVQTIQDPNGRMVTEETILLESIVCTERLAQVLVDIPPSNTKAKKKNVYWQAKFANSQPNSSSVLPDDKDYDF